jgi:hypothetical protein
LEGNNKTLFLTVYAQTQCEELVMKKYLSLMLVSLFLLASQQSSAGSITCGSYMIEDGQINGQSREEVEEKCGVPDDRSGNDYFYKQENVTYRLHFNDGDELESITEQVEE